jgi:hypothetical protein
MRAPGGARRSRTDDILLAKQALYQLSYGPVPEERMLSPGELSATRSQPRVKQPEGLVGPGRLELPTLRLSGVRSNQAELRAYGSATAGKPQARDRTLIAAGRMPNADEREMRKEKRRRRHPAVYWSVNNEPRESFTGDASLERR